MLLALALSPLECYRNPHQTKMGTKLSSPGSQRRPQLEPSLLQAQTLFRTQLTTDMDNL